MRSQISIKTHRIYLNQDLCDDQSIIISDLATINYLKNVLRLRQQDNLRIFNGKHGEYLGMVSSIDKNRLIIKLVDQLLPQPQAELKRKLIVGIGILKTATMSEAVNIATQLDAHVIYPVVTERSQFKEINHDKYKKIIIQSCEQCERLSIPALMPAITLTNFLSQHQNTFVANEHSTHPLSRELNIKNHDIAVLIGPEGGFTYKENDILRASQAHSIMLGPNIMRAEIALAVLIGQVLIY